MRKIETEDVVSILEYFKDLKDPRSTINRKHWLGDLIVICILAVVAGADGPKAIGAWARANQDWLSRYLKLPGGIPSHDTIGRLLAALKPQAFQECFQAWLNHISEEVSQDTDGQEEIREPREQIAIDGKAMRRSHDRRHHLGPLHVVSAWSVRRGISLGQLATEEKSNEITAIPQLLDQISVTRAIVTIDAAGCYRQVAQKIVQGGGDYVLALKGNQRKLARAVRQYILDHMENDFADVTARRYTEVLTGHGRVDRITYIQLPAPASLPGISQWGKLKTIGVAIRISQRDGKETSDVRHYISSLSLGARQFAESVRGHWAIENTLHWCLDVTFREDESRLRDRHAADNVSWLKRFAISLLKQRQDKESVAMRRRLAGWNPQYLLQTLGISPR